MAENTLDKNLRPDFRIDLDAVIDSRKGGEKIPRFVRSVLKRFIHIDEINDFLAEGKEGLEFCQGAMRFLDIRAEISGKENFDLIPAGSKCTIVSNHPLGGIDGIVTIAMLNERFGTGIRLLANSFLMELKGLAPLCIPINKTGKQSRNFPAMVEAGFQSDNHILMYPAGICSRRQPDGQIRDIKWTKTFIAKSVEYQRDVVPIRFGGQNSDFFYKLANFSDKHIKKVNIAMLFLVDEMYKNVHKTFEVKIGKPIPWQTFDKSKSATEWAQYVKDIVYKI